MDALWPDGDIAAMRNGGSYYEGAAICRRGHVETPYIDPSRERPVIAENCPECGARVLTSCPSCRLRIRGEMFVPGVIGFGDFKRPSFCDGCGAAYPWATRAERIYELENLLDEEEIDEADRVVVQGDLARLRTQEMNASDEKHAWERVVERSGAALSSGPVQRVLEGLVSAAIRHQLGI
ncbi:DUF2321 domain-containing protein [Cellulomonas sp. T2.31MG-18]|uniref:DUF2321 domain-containing protein n=1 Tax=Cellulomonas sp. T2.31MG-18 TaxID=3157619 RepID=UPI00366BEEA5